MLVRIWRLSPFYARSYFLGGCSFPPFPCISVSAMQATASPSISFLLTFCTYQNPPHAIISPQKHNKQSHLSCKNYPLGIKFLLDRICLLKKMFSHSKHVWNLEWIFPFIKTLWIWRVGPRPPSQYLAVKPELPNKTRTDSSNDQGFPEDFLAFFVHSS